MVIQAVIVSIYMCVCVAVRRANTYGREKTKERVRELRSV
jgi:hypothetical protein